MNLRHIALVVPDIQVGIDFYSGIGCQLKSTDREAGNFVSHLMGLTDCELLTCKLRVFDGSVIELIEFVQPSLLTIISSQPRSMAFIGLHHLAFTVLEIDSTITSIMKLGGSIISSPMSVPKEHSVNAVPALHCYVSDPFGNIIHLAQDIPSKKSSQTI